MHARKIYLFNRFIISSLMLITLLFGLIVDMQATIATFLDVEDLTHASSHVFRGQVISTQVFWTEDHKNIYTAVGIRIDESLKGDLSLGQTITIKQLGGEIDGISLDYEGRPIFTVGESVVMFTTKPRTDSFVVTGLKQGKMRVDGDTLIRDFSGLTLIEKRTTDRGVAQQAVQNARTRIPMDELRNRVARTK